MVDKDESAEEALVGLRIEEDGTMERLAAACTLALPPFQLVIYSLNAALGSSDSCGRADGGAVFGNDKAKKNRVSNEPSSS